MELKNKLKNLRKSGVPFGEHRSFHILLFEIIEECKQSTFLHSNPEIRGNLNPPVLAKNKGTAVFRLVPLRGEVSESVPLFRGYYVERGTTCIILLIVDVPKGNPALSPS